MPRWQTKYTTSLVRRSFVSGLQNARPGSANGVARSRYGAWRALSRQRNVQVLTVPQVSTSNGYVLTDGGGESDPFQDAQSAISVLISYLAGVTPRIVNRA
jgi:hypothetical protein